MTEYSVYISELVFDSIKADYAAHDKSCSSIPNMWLGSKGGFSCFNEQENCDGCKVTFYWEGLHENGFILDEDGYEAEAYYCDCCNRKVNKDKDG